jgi:hypothetical protein
MKFWLLMLLIGRLGHVTCDPDWRLPQMATPLHYQVTLLPLLEDGGQLCGHVWIDVRIERDSNFVIVNAAEMEVLEATLEPHANEVMEQRVDRVEDLCFSGVTGRDPGANRTVLEYFSLSDQLELLTLFSPFGLAAGQRFRIGLLFRAKIYEGSAQAFHRMSYTDDKDCCKK